MKRFIISIGIIAMVLILLRDRLVIPKESLRVRVIANSNSKYDQDIKKGVKDILEKDLYSYLKDSKNISEARNIVVNNLGDIDKKIENYLEKEEYKLPYEVDYGYHYFPKKEYRGISYDEGMYESLLVTLGNGEGDNWWCVMFPPFCLIESNESIGSDIEYRWYIKDLLNKYFQF